MDTRKPNPIAQVSSDPVTTRRRPLLFLATYFIGVIIITGLKTIPYINHPVAKPDSSFFLERFITAIFFLPWGIVVALEWILNLVGTNADLIRTEGPFPGPSSVLGGLIGVFDYLLCFIIVLIGCATKKQRTFRILFFIFMGLLIINIAGCSVA